MAQRRMFSIQITDSDDFISLPQTAQALYFHLCMHADDDGFLNNVNGIIRSVCGNKEDYKTLCDAGYIIALDSAVSVVTHWKVHNYIQKDRYRPSLLVKYKDMVDMDAGKAYFIK